MKSIKKEVTILRPIEKVWEYLIDPQKLAGWLMPNNFEAEVGKKFTFQCKSEDPNWDGKVFCQVKEIIPQQKMVWSWRTNQAEIETEVTITLQKMGKRTKVTLVHTGWDKLPPERDFLFDNYDSGWQGFIGQNLKELIEEA